MPTRVLSLLCALTLCAAAVAQTNARKPPSPPPAAAEYDIGAWKEYSSPDGMFRVALVGALRQETRTLDSAAGKVSLHLFGSDSGTGVYMVAYLDLAQTPEEPAAVRRALDAGRDRMLAENKNRRLLSEREITVEGRLAREVLIEDGELFYANRLFLTGGRLYQLLLAAPLNIAFNSGRPSNDSKDWTDLYRAMSARFFSSFKLLPATPPGGAVTSLPYGDPILRPANEESEPKAQVSAGVLNGRAINKPTPVYPPEAREVTGTVAVRVVFDESGKVIWARAVSGHPLLRAAAEEAARGTMFPPMTVEGKPVKVSGVLTYLFKH